MQNKSKQKMLEKALIKRAIGYDAQEIVEEFSCDENNVQILTKRKITTKHFTPDVTAIKILLAFYGETSPSQLEEMSDEQLKIERDKLLMLLKNEEEKIKE